MHKSVAYEGKVKMRNKYPETFSTEPVTCFSVKEICSGKENKIHSCNNPVPQKPNSRTLLSYPLIMNDESVIIAGSNLKKKKFFRFLETVTRYLKKNNNKKTTLLTTTNQSERGGEGLRLRSPCCMT